MKSILFILFAFAHISHAESEDQDLDREVRAFVRKGADNGGGIIDHYNRKESDRILKTPHDWEGVLYKMLDIQTYSEREIETVLNIISYRGSSSDPRVNKALLNYFDQLSEKTYNAGLNNSENKESVKMKNYLSSQVTTLARLKDPDMLEKLMVYAISSQEADLLAFGDPAYANIFIGTEGVETKRHGDLLERLLPKLKERGLKEKTISLGEKTLQHIRSIQPKKVSNKSRANRADPDEDEFNTVSVAKSSSKPAETAELSQTWSKSKWPVVLVILTIFGSLFFWLKVKAHT